MNFFKNISDIGITNIDIKVLIKDGIVSVLVDPKSTAKDKAIQIIQPVSISGTPEEIDLEFFNIITEPLKKTAGVITNIEEHEKSVNEASKKKADVTKSKKPAEKTDDDSSDEIPDGEGEETKTEKAEKPKAEPKVPKEKPIKPVPEYKFKKYEDAVREITDVPGFKLKATNKIELKEKVDYLLVMDKTNKFALEWEKKIKEFVPSIFDDEDEDEIPEPIVEEKTEPVMETLPPSPPTETIVPKEEVVQKIAEYKSSFEKAAEQTPPPPPADEPNPFDDDDDLPDTDYESMTD